MTKLDRLAQTHDFRVKQRPKGSASLIVGGRKLAAAVRKLTR